MEDMEKTVRIFHSFEEADAAEVAEDLLMKPEQRIAVVLELQKRIHPDASEQRFARVYRITQHEQS